MTSPRIFRASAVALAVAAAAILVISNRRPMPGRDAAPVPECKACEFVTAPPPPLPQESNALPGTAETPVASDAPAAQSELAAPPPPLEPALAMRQDLRWRAAVPEPEFSAFREWTGRFEKATPERRTLLLAEGRKLVEQRRQEMSELIDKDPKRALELAVPVAVRRMLPAEIASGIEEPVRGRGDLWVSAALPLPGQELRVRTTQRTVQMSDGRLFDAYTFGRRANSPTRLNIAIHGVALDGKLALDEFPGRVLEPVEAAEAKAGGELCPESGIPADALGEEVAVDFGDAKPLFFCGPAHAFSALADAADAEGKRLPAIAAAGGDGGGGDPPIAQSGYTEGTKKMLIIRVDFPDFAGQVVSDSTLTTLISNMKTHWEDMSYGKTSWTLSGSGSAVTPTLRLPNGHASYTDFGTMLAAARAAAADAGYDYRDYNFEVVVTGSRPSVGFGGIAFVGARGAWLANSSWNLGVCSHEVGHNFGLNHAGFWDTDDGNPIGAGSAVEYGNPFDHMGGASSSFDAHFGARQKNYLDWIVDADVRKIGSDGQVLQRISAFDAKAATGFKAIAVDRAGTSSNDYWVEYRGEYADTNNDMKEGVVLNWGPYSIDNAKPLLIDNSPTTGSLDDATVLIGRTFSDSTAGIHITPVARGTDAGTGARWIDVQVNRGAFAGNQKPTLSVMASNLNPAVSASVTFTATASDPNGDTLAYFWEWGDGTYTANNSTSATHAWTSSGTKTVRCRISDMKGMTATGQVLVQVGSSSTFFIQGTVANTSGVGIEGVVVTAGSASDTTDSEGYYAVTGLPAGSYAVAAAKTGLTINPNGFTNPVVVGPSKQNINFTAPPGAPTFGTMKPGLLDQGSSTGPIILPLSDPDTAVTALTLSAVSSNTAIIPNASVTFGTKGTTVRTVTASAASTVSGTVDITITATDPQGSSANYVWPVTVNGKPVLSVATQNVAENSSVDIDLRTMAADDFTTDDALHFEISRVRGGTATLLADGHTAHFTPVPNYQGAASFLLTTRDQSLSSRTQFIYDFEPPDTTADGKITDQSNYLRNATFETAGTGGEYSYTPEVPAALAPFSAQSVHLSESGTGASRIRKTMAATDINWNDEDWTFSAWVKRASRDTDDIIMHLGVGDGFGSESELHLHFEANDDVIRLSKFGPSGVTADLAGPGLPVGTWHQISVVYDRTATNTGTLVLFVDGFLYGVAGNVPMDVSQSAAMYLGGAEDNTQDLDRWFDGSLDDVVLQTNYGGDAEIWGLAHRSARHELGIATSATVNVTVTGVNQPPAITPVADVGLFVGQTSPPIPFVLSDAESEARTLTVTGGSSNASVVAPGGIAISAVPAAWSSSDVGTVAAAGSLIEDHGTFIVAGSGSGFAGTTDDFRWIRQDLTGDGEMFARVLSVDYTDSDSKAGVMLRESSSNGGGFAMACVTPGEGVKFVTRSAAGAQSATVAEVNGVAAPVWLRIARVGSSYTAFYATDNGGTPGPWQQIGTAQNVTMAAGANRCGIAVSSEVDGTLCTAVVDKIGGSPKLGGERTVTITPVAGAQGTAVITLTSADGLANSQRQFTVTVSPNTPPTMDPVADVNATDGVGVPSFTINVGDVHTPGSLTVTGSSSNTTLLPNNRIIITGTGTTRTVQLLPIPSETGSATVTLTVSDGLLSTQRTFTFTVGSGDPGYFIRAGANWRYLDNGTNPVGWQFRAFNDSSWAVGPAQLGFGEGDEATPINATPSRVVTYFRHAFNVAEPAQWAHMKLRILRDDGAVIYLNNVEIFRSNVGPGAVTGSTQAAAAAVENVWDEVFIVNPPLFTGNNVLAVSVHQFGTTSTDLSFDLEARGFGPSGNPVIATGADWHYLDDGTNPGATWMTSGFAETAAWKVGPSQLGYGDGDEATVVASGPAGAYHITTYFRKKFSIADPTHFEQAAIHLLRDDGAVVYLNGAELFRDNLPAAPAVITTSTPADSSIGNAAEGVRIIHRFNPALLLHGENTIAVEIHQRDATSSDISFDLELSTYAPNSVPHPVPVIAENQLTLTWPSWAGDWQLYSTTDFIQWTAVTTPPVQIAGGSWQVTLPLSGPRKYFRLEKP